MNDNIPLLKHSDLHITNGRTIKRIKIIRYFQHNDIIEFIQPNGKNYSNLDMEYVIIHSINSHSCNYLDTATMNLFLAADIMLYPVGHFRSIDSPNLVNFIKITNLSRGDTKMNFDLMLNRNFLMDSKIIKISPHLPMFLL